LPNREQETRERDVAQRRPVRHRDDVAHVVDGLRRIVRALHQSHRRAEQRWQLSAAQLLVLQRLAEEPTLSVNELANRTFTHQSTVSVVVARLVSRGLVRRSRADEDARRAELALTPSGRALLRRAMSSAQAQLFDALEAMPSARLRVIASGIDDVVHALGVEAEPAGMFFEE
jgi:DNA-binding MarR family transcriptional regulator